MLGIRHCHPLEDDWRETLDAVAHARGWATSRDVAKLAAGVAALSAAYNDPARARADVRGSGAARLGFSFVRDVPKGAAAARELLAVGALATEGTLRVLDWGSGFGATTWGLVRALDAAGARCAVDATWIDEDREALDVAAAIARLRAGRGVMRGSVALRVARLVRAGGAIGDLGRFDVVLAGQVLSELDVGMPETTRARRHADLLGGWLERHTEPGGVLIVVEPALRDRTRHLHRVRDELATRGTTIFAPCLHAASCPALARENDWCHEDLPVDLPAWLVPIARAAGLRHQGLTFSYLVLRQGGPRLADAYEAPSGAARLRVVSAPLRTKGKHEAFVCGELASSVAPPGALVPGGARAMRLDRDARPENALWEELARGEVFCVAPPIDSDRPRVVAITRIDRFGETESR